MHPGHIITYPWRKNSLKMVVVMANDCRAVVVPLGQRDPTSPDAVFSESDSGAESISASSCVEILGRVAGQIAQREAALPKWTRPPVEEILVPRPSLKKSKLTVPVPGPQPTTSAGLNDFEASIQRAASAISTGLSGSLTNPGS